MRYNRINIEFNTANSIIPVAVGTTNVTVKPAVLNCLRVLTMSKFDFDSI